jgi:adenine-specific DNA-methyltransferase
MALTFPDFVSNRKLMTLAKLIGHDRDSLLQLLLSLCRKETFSRIVFCPTYPVRVLTLDMKDRLSLFMDVLSGNPYEISNVLAFLYEHTMDNEYRKNRGQYFTPPPIAKQMIDIIGLKNGETVLDPGSGTGIFPLTILVNKPNVAASLRYVGIEADSVLALSTAISLEWMDAPRCWRAMYANFLSVKRDDLAKFDLSEISVIVANPPFVNYHRLGERKRTARERGLSNLAGLHSYFLDHCTTLTKNARMVFILPSEMNETQYGSKLLRQLQGEFKIDFRRIYYDKQTRMLAIVKIPFAGEAEMRPLATLTLFEPLSRSEKREIASKESKTREKTILLKHIAFVHRGISTGMNDFFLLTETMVRKLEVPHEWLCQIMPTRIRSSELVEIIQKTDWEKLRDEGRRCYLLSIKTTKPFSGLPDTLKHYLRDGERRGIHLIPTCKSRDPWYYVRKPDQVPDILFTYMSRGYPKFLLNKAHIFNLTNLLGVHLKSKVNLTNERLIELTRALTKAIREWIDQESVGRIYSGGLIKFEPHDLERLPLSHKVLESLGLTSLEERVLTC